VLKFGGCFSGVARTAGRLERPGSLVPKRSDNPTQPVHESLARSSPHAHNHLPPRAMPSHNAVRGGRRLVRCLEIVEEHAMRSEFTICQAIPQHSPTRQPIICIFDLNFSIISVLLACQTHKHDRTHFPQLYSREDAPQ
jgi:hypothetical protein